MILLKTTIDVSNYDLLSLGHLSYNQLNIILKKFNNPFNREFIKVLRKTHKYMRAWMIISLQSVLFGPSSQPPKYSTELIDYGNKIYSEQRRKLSVIFKLCGSGKVDGLDTKLK